MSLFEQAARKKIRFETSAGVWTVEDLWDMPLEKRGRLANLNDLAIGLHNELQATQVSFVTPVTEKNSDIQLKFDLVKHVIDTRLAENTAAAARVAKAQEKQKLLAILARKKEGDLEGKTVEELEAMIAAL